MVNLSCESTVPFVQADENRDMQDNDLFNLNLSIRLERSQSSIAEPHALETLVKNTKNSSSLNKIHYLK